MARARKVIRRVGGKKTAAPSARPRPRPRVSADVRLAHPELFEPLTEGERADALRLAVEEPRLRAMAKVGRYRVVAVEPLPLKPPDPRAGHRLARVVIYDYAAIQAVDASVDLDTSEVFHVHIGGSQPMLSDDEESDAIDIALADEGVQEQLGLGDEPLGAAQYWSKQPSDISYSRRCAAVLFGPRGGAATLVAVVNLIERVVAEVVPAASW